jgi:choline dehydrogenase-like flavoprotein
MDAYDLVIVGTGAGGGALARHLALAGKRVLLLLERDDWFLREPPPAPARLREERDPGGRVCASDRCQQEP